MRTNLIYNICIGLKLIKEHFMVGTKG